mgnify:CR=1 FL=1
MTQKETTLLKVERSKLITGIDIIVEMDRKSKSGEYYIRIGESEYYNFGEALALLNDLEKHAQ